jgi:recombination protein RecT
MKGNTKEISNNVLIRKIETKLYTYDGLITDLLENHNMTAYQFLGMAMNTIKRNPQLLGVFRKNPKSVFGRILMCAELGLSPSQEMGECWLIAKNGYCQFQLGYQGLVKLMYRHPNIKGVFAESVYEKDDFMYQLGLDPKLEHIPSSEKDKGALTHVYAVIKYTDGEKIFKVMSRNELEEYKNLSESGDSNYWFTSKDPQNWLPKKTAIKQLCKIIPKFVDLSTAISYDSKIEGGGQITEEQGVVQVIESKIKSKKNGDNKFSVALENLDIEESE